MTDDYKLVYGTDYTEPDVQRRVMLIARSLDKQADLAGDPMDREWAKEMAAAVRTRGNI